VDDAIELADVIWQLRADLTRAMWGGENKDLRFKAEKVELELAVGVEKSREPGARVKFWVFDVGANARRTTSVRQTMRLTLQPVLGDAPDQPAVIGGNAVENED
jgi:hypothetical protein